MSIRIPGDGVWRRSGIVPLRPVWVRFNRRMFPDLLRVRTPLVSFHVLKDESGLVLLDAGFIGGPRIFRCALMKCGWEHEPVRGILLTHGHLDHVLNVARLAEETGARIAAPRLDGDRYLGRTMSRGWSRVAGLLEGIGRRCWASVPSLRIVGSMMVTNSKHGVGCARCICRDTRKGIPATTVGRGSCFSAGTSSRA